MDNQNSMNEDTIFFLFLPLMIDRMVQGVSIHWISLLRSLNVSRIIMNEKFKEYINLFIDILCFQSYMNIIILWSFFFRCINIKMVKSDVVNEWNSKKEEKRRWCYFIKPLCICIFYKNDDDKWTVDHMGPIGDVLRHWCKLF